MQYLEKINDTPNFSITALREEIRRDWMVGISKFKAYRALKLALEVINESHTEQYKHCYDYAVAISQWNLESTTIIHRECGFFKHMYVCLSTCRTRFLTWYRPIISVDACHLKGPYGGQLFCADANDANEDMFRISYAVCEKQCLVSWLWFLDMLVDDVGTFDPR